MRLATYLHRSILLVSLFGVLGGCAGLRARVKEGEVKGGEVEESDHAPAAPASVEAEPVAPIAPRPAQRRPGMAYVDRHASVMGSVEMGASVYVAPGASIRGALGQPIHLGAQTNVQDGVVIHGLEPEEGGEQLPDNLVHVGERTYGVFIGDRVSLAHQAQIHGPSLVGEDTVVGVQALVFRAEVGDHCVLEPRAMVMGVKVAAGRYVPAGQVVTTQEEADHLPIITPQYSFARVNRDVLHPRPSGQAAQRQRQMATRQAPTPE